MDNNEKLDLIIAKLGKLDKLEDRFDKLEDRFDKLEDRLGKLEDRFDKLEDRFDKLEDRFDKLEDRFDKLEDRFDKLEDRFDKLEDRFGKLEYTVRDIKLTLENETNKNIMRVAEGHLDLSRKLDEALKIENEKEMIAIRVNILENELRRLKERLDQIA